MTNAGDVFFTTEGVKLSGADSGKYCILMALRRSPEKDAEGARRESANLSGKRTELN